MADQLDDIRIATPCTMNWSEMSGDDQKRFCGSCRLNVYNVRMMTRGEAVRLIQETEGRVCLRLYRRHDGTVITKDCPVGLAALRARIVRGVGVSVAAFLGLMGFGSFVNERQQKLARPVTGEVPTMSVDMGEPMVGKPVRSQVEVGRMRAEPRMGRLAPTAQSGLDE